MIRIVTVLRSGGQYRPEHVLRLKRQCDKFAPGAPFLCVSDIELPEEVARVPMMHRWPLWWPKIEVFAFRGPVLYMDLDTTVVGDLAPILNSIPNHEFMGLRDFNWPDRELQSSIMGWSGDVSYLRKTFEKQPEVFMSENKSRRWWGDQGFIEKLLRNGFIPFQDVVPGMIVSFKKHVRPTGIVPNGARIVVFHGKPRPWDIEELKV